MNTLSLSNPTLYGAEVDSTTGWDIYLDSSGNLSIKTGGQALAQDVASAVRTFKSECWYDRTLGVPYFQNILGYRVSLQFVKQALVTAASIVPGVASIACFLTGPVNRAVGGQLQITSQTGEGVPPVSTGDVVGQLPWWSNAGASASGADT